MTSSTPFEQFGPDEPASPVILSVPHAGRDYPASLMAASRVRPDQLRALEDRHADALISEARAAGYTALVATTARAWIDLNRDPREIDPDMIASPAPARPLLQSVKVRGGLGLFPRRLHGPGDLWRHRFDHGDLAARIETAHEPYHARLEALLKEARARFGIAVLVDIHSMPPLKGEPTCHLVVGDLFGRSASGRFTAAIQAIALGARLGVAQNTPYAGGYTLARHGTPAHGIHALQLEVDRSLYLDAALHEPGSGLARSRALILTIVRALEEEALGTAAIAAE